jgi:oligopeptide/dipeptide ABC transporter ATP-binding protein
MQGTSNRILEVDALRTYFFTEAGIVKAVDGVSFGLAKGETLGLVGESGSGKTITALSVLRIVPRPGRIVDGKITFAGTSLLDLPETEMRRIRGSKIAIVFQDPSSSLNPVFTVGDQIADIIIHHQNLGKREAFQKTVDLLDMVGIGEAETRAHQYPHQLSGGMKQRIAVARALACEPTLLFADEPTTNLDVTIQAQVLELIKDLKRKLNMSLVMITHDMGIIAEMTDRVTVLYAGCVCESASTVELFKAPRHPYTVALLGAVPRVDRAGKLNVIPGNIPNLIEPPSGCRFHPRCGFATDVCRRDVPQLVEVSPDHWVACHRTEELTLQS